MEKMLLLDPLKSLQQLTENIIQAVFGNQKVRCCWVVFNGTVCRKGSSSKQSFIIRADTP